MLILECELLTIERLFSAKDNCIEERWEMGNVMAILGQYWSTTQYSGVILNWSETLPK